jgi:aspartyl-tRNA(Asn)/glutamyl-tRNA(Gln) amidotransferase subunit A
MSPIYRFENPDPASALPDGPLHGMRVALQSTVSVAGWPTDADSAALTDFTALEDATVVQRLRQAGAALTGLTRASEFGFGLHGSQAGEAVRSGAADAELVLDMMGECRVAAARAGAFGLVPSVGLVSRLGLIGLIPSMERCGLLARSCDTLSTLLAALAGPDGRDLTLEETPLPPPAPLPDDGRGVTLGVIPQALEGLPVAQAEGFRAAIDRLTAAGITVCELTLPEYNLFDLVHAIVGAVEASSCAGRYDSVRYGHRPPGAKDWNEMYLSARGAAFGTCVKSFLIQGAFFQFERYAAYENACRIRARLVAAVQQLMPQVDALALPLADCVPEGATATLAEARAPFASTLLASVTGQPALALPAAGACGALQLVGSRLGDARLLALGGMLAALCREGK